MTGKAQITVQLNYMSRQANKLREPPDEQITATARGAKLRRSQMTPDARRANDY